MLQNIVIRDITEYRILIRCNILGISCDVQATASSSSVTPGRI